MRKVPGFGPDKAQIVIVGEAPGSDEEMEGKPFVGASSRELNAWLRESGLNRDDCYVTNVCKYRPPMNKIETWIIRKGKVSKEDFIKRDGVWISPEVQEGLAELPNEILSHEPSVIIGLGNVPLWALSGQWGIADWRGSELLWDDIPFVPTLHPAGVLRNWPTRTQATHDIKFRVARRLRNGFYSAPFKFNIAPTFEEAVNFLKNLKGDVSIDVETSKGKIVCVGFAWSQYDAMCIPFIGENGAYWPQNEYIEILYRMLEAFKRKSLRVIGQNFQYDASYFKDNFGYAPMPAFDTLIAESVLYPGMPRALGYLSSMYCDWHQYWKDDARDWNNLSDFAGLFKYNCRDVCSTWEIAQEQNKRLAAAGLMPQFLDRMKYGNHVFDMMMRGVNRDVAYTMQMENEIDEALIARRQQIADKRLEISGATEPLNLASPIQVSKVLYQEWGCRKPARRGKDAGGTGEEELKQLIAWHPELEKELTAILEYRSLNSLKNNFLHAVLDPDGKLRGGWMPTGTETFRLTCGKNNFRRGTNLMNVTGRDESRSGNKVPILRKCIIPDNEYTFFDCDLERADLQVVVWEANDADLKAKMRSGADIHMENAKDLFGCSMPSDFQRESAKQFVHLTNYGGKARTAAIKCGCTVHEAEMAQRRWFAAHPGVSAWHKRVEASLQRHRSVSNAFGYRIIFFDRMEGLLKEALAWIPQSTIAIVASKVHMAMDEAENLDVLIQLHDSVAGQYLTEQEDKILPLMYKATKVIIPYDDPLIIPMGLKTSPQSWGDVAKRNWS